jgi:hypothetical protein
MSQSSERLTAFIERVGPPQRSLVFTDPDVPVPFRRLLAEGFEEQHVSVDGVDPEVDGNEESAVALVEDGEVLHTSSLESYLLVNSDLYRTGTVGLAEFDPPSVLMNLDETRFRLRGYPASNKEKLLLVLVSRYIERLA